MKKLQSPIDLLKLAFETTKRQFWPLLICMFLPFLMGGGVAIMLAGPAVLAGILLKPLLLVIGLLLISGMVIISLWQGATSIELLAGATEKLGLNEALKKTWPKLGKYFGVSFLVSIMTFGAVIPFVLPVFVVAVWFSFATYVVVLEGVGGIKALRISREYARGKYFAILGRLAFLILIYMAFGFAQAFFQLIFGKNIGALFSIFNLPLSILVMAYQYHLYKNLREIRGTIDPKEVELGKSKWIGLAIWGIVVTLIIPLLFIVMAVRFGINAAEVKQPNYSYRQSLDI